MTDKDLEQIRQRFDAYSLTMNGAYRAFMQCAHKDVGALLDEVDRLKAQSGCRVGDAPERSE